MQIYNAIFMIFILLIGPLLLGAAISLVFAKEENLTIPKKKANTIALVLLIPGLTFVFSGILVQIHHGSTKDIFMYLCAIVIFMVVGWISTKIAEKRSKKREKDTKIE